MDPDVIIFLVLALVVLFCFTVFMVLSYSGLFYEPVVNTGEPPWHKSITIAYRYIRGLYSGSDVGNTFTEVTCLAPKAIPIGIFYDNPREVESEKLRCIVGCIIKEGVGDDDERSLVNDDELKFLQEKDFKVHNIPAIDRAVLTDFVYTTPFSIWLAPNRVYPRLSEYIADRGLCAYPMIETYVDCKIKYAAPLSKQEDFFVPECHDEALNNSADSSEAGAENAVAANAGGKKKSPVDDKHERERGGHVTTLDGPDESGSDSNDDDVSSFEEIGDEELKRKASDGSKKND